jgi:2-methylcitrate synthase
MSETKKTGGLAGIVAGETSISTVGKEGVGLTYRGYTIEDLAGKATFEEVAYLLIYGALPTASELEVYRKKLISMRGLPAALKTTLEQIAWDDRTGKEFQRTGANREPPHSGISVDASLLVSISQIRQAH